MADENARHMSTTKGRRETPKASLGAAHMTTIFLKNAIRPDKVEVAIEQLCKQREVEASAIRFKGALLLAERSDGLHRFIAAHALGLPVRLKILKSSTELGDDDLVRHLTIFLNQPGWPDDMGWMTSALTSVDIMTIDADEQWR